ncbi:MAG: sigma-70 family RNA polymerase sigma factor [Isosphaeraceae bacterium]
MGGERIGAISGSFHRLFDGGTVAGLSERQLLDRFLARNDAAAFEAIVARHGPMVLGVCRRLLDDPNDADDAFQATFLVLVRKARELRQRDLLANWLYGVALPSPGGPGSRPTRGDAGWPRCRRGATGWNPPTNSAASSTRNSPACPRLPVAPGALLPRRPHP